LRLERDQVLAARPQGARDHSAVGRPRACHRGGGSRTRDRPGDRRQERIESVVGKGTTVTLLFPPERVTAAIEQSLTPPIAAGAAASR